MKMDEVEVVHWHFRKRERRWGKENGSHPEGDEKAPEWGRKEQPRN